MRGEWVLRLLRLRVRLLRLWLPAWLLAAGVAGAAVAGGLAVGPILDGGVSGLVGLTVEQSVVVEAIEVRDWPPTMLYSISPRDNKLRVVDTSGVVETTSSVTITLAGEVVEGGNGIAADPTDNDKLYALLKLQGQSGRELVTIDPSTGIATSVGAGNTGDRFAGLAFDLAGTLYAVTGDGAGVPETLYTLSKTTAAPTFVLTLENGNEGETIAFNPDDGLIYHASGLGIPNVNEIFEAINPATLTVTSITLKGQDYTEATALTYEGDATFFLADLGRRLYRINTEGVSQYEGVLDHDTHGLVPFDLAHVDDSLGVLNDEGTSFTAAIESHVGDSYMLILTLKNKSDEDANVMLELNVPSVIDVQLQAVGSITEAQLSKRAWVLKVPSTLTEGKIRIIFESQDDAPLEFYTITGRLTQIAP